MRIITARTDRGSSRGAAASVSQELPRRPDAPLERYDNADLELGACAMQAAIACEPGDGAARSGQTPGHHADGMAELRLGGAAAKCDRWDLQAAAADHREERRRTMRLDKPGMGDSEGDCRETDFDTELSGYRAAFAALKAHPRVDPARIGLLGISNGGGFAPLVAQGAPSRHTSALADGRRPGSST